MYFQYPKMSLETLETSFMFTELKMASGQMSILQFLL